MEKDKFVEVVYITSENSIIQKKINYSENLTIKTALISLENENLNFSNIKNKEVGLFGKIINDYDTKLKPFDRIEIYDNLNDSPNERRKKIFKKRNI